MLLRWSYWPGPFHQMCGLDKHYKLPVRSGTKSWPKSKLILLSHIIHPMAAVLSQPVKRPTPCNNKQWALAVIAEDLTS